MRSIQAIVYTSNAGHTRAYAELLGKQTSLSIYDLVSAGNNLPQGSPIIYLGWLMAGRIKGYKQAAALYSIQAVCGVGMAGGSQLQDMKKANVLPDSLPVFYLQGGFDMDKLQGVYQLMMKMMKSTVGKSMAEKKDRTLEEDDMLLLLNQGGDRVSVDQLQGILQWYAAE